MSRFVGASVLIISPNSTQGSADKRPFECDLHTKEPFRHQCSIATRPQIPLVCTLRVVLRFIRLCSRLNYGVMSLYTCPTRVLVTHHKPTMAHYDVECVVVEDNSGTPGIWLVIAQRNSGTRVPLSKNSREQY
jgi:hypothetical protein